MGNVIINAQSGFNKNKSRGLICRNSKGSKA
jgi:hypothetical protein